MRLWAFLLLALITLTLAADESCMSRCENGFSAEKTCQCDSMCKYYNSCCSDFKVYCGMMTRGDTFVFAEDDDDDSELLQSTTPSPQRSSHSLSINVTDRKLKPTEQHISDFGRRQQEQHETTLEMTRPPRLMETILQKIPITRKTPVSKTVATAQITTETPVTEAAVETTTGPVTTATTEAPDPDAMACSGRPFDSFMQQKNGSIYAFRGEYFFELDKKTVLPGYPKLIKDVWGISGPIDAAFTRVNCKGKTYIFKGNKYWRFDNGVMDEDYPRDISVGFDKIPDHVDAAFSLPAPGHNGKEKVYFFKGDQYHTYEFLHQPSHDECITMSESSPPLMFRRYTDVYYNNYERVISELFSSSPQHHDKHHFIDKDWKGLKSPVDAVMAGRMYVPPVRPAQRRNDYQPGPPRNQQNGQNYQQYGQQYGLQWAHRRQSRSPYWGSTAEQGMNMGQGFADRGMDMGLRLAERGVEMEERLRRDWNRRWDQDSDQDRRRGGTRQNDRGNHDSRNVGSVSRSLPIQSVYFFRGESYYRVDLKTKRVDPASPPYPRSIAKFWLGCSDTTGAEK
ncbi:hypothetical protein CesoFtcFv8_006179 [Champsocephalus esox]|uniref:SMB domain-containing protein n=1 Tax=Champsocephalus esox TaxID=159716 RepID=A0AAN8H6L6_9TELE|nr:hypothetical protein CesoFtcFv8_006179 [Champsocephalus esox]